MEIFSVSFSFRKEEEKQQQTTTSTTMTTTTTTTTAMERARPDEFVVSLVRYASVSSAMVKQVIGLEDDTVLIQTWNEVFHVSRSLRVETLNLNIDCGLTTIRPWNRDSVVVCTRYVLNGSPNVFLLWNFRSGEKSTPVSPVENKQVLRIETLQLDGVEEKYFAIGTDKEVYLTRVPSFEVIHILNEPSVGAIQEILPLLDGNSFLCGYLSPSSQFQLIRWFKDDDTKTVCGGFKRRLFEPLGSPVQALLQMRHDPRKLIIRWRSDRRTTDRIYSVWDMETATTLYTLPDLYFWTSRSLFELGDSGLFMSGSSFQNGLRIWDLRGEGELLFETKRKFHQGVQLNNGNILLVYRYKHVLYIEEHQVTR